MELSLTNDLVIQCDECNEIIIIDKDSLGLETYSYERNMGAEVEYNFMGESSCNVCGNVLEYYVRGYEYPIGAFNYQNHECFGGRFVQPPEMTVEYYEFDYDDFEEDRIISDISNKSRIINRIIDNDESIYDLSAREFEDLVAQIFEEQGYRVTLTPQTRDGGCDIIATCVIGGLAYSVLIECKKYSRERKVGVALVRSLLGVLEDGRANKGVIVTSSEFTKDARRFAERQNTLIELVDVRKLMQMMQLSR